MKPVILDILLNSSSPLKRPELLRMLHERLIYTNDRAMRKAIEEMIEEGELISSSAKGYEFIHKEDQVMKSMEYLRKKSKGIAVRANYLIHNWRKRHPESRLQLELF